MKRSIRLRILVVIALLLVPLSAAAAWLLVELFGNRLLHDVDVSLEEEAETLAQIIGKPGYRDVEADLLTHIAAESDLGHDKLVVVERDGQVAAEAPVGAAEVLATKPHLLRIARSQSGATTVFIGLPVRNALGAKRGLVALLAVVTPAIVLATLAVLWFVIRGALRPLEEAARQIEGVDLENLTPLRVYGGRDELGIVFDALSRMLERLNAAVAHLHRFTADAAHELRTPLTVLRTGLEVALARERSAQDYRTALGESLATTDRICRLADDLLLLARLDGPGAPPSRVPVNLTEMLGELADAWKPTAEVRGVSLRVCEAPVLGVDGDARDLYRLFNNLIENALRHSPVGGTIELSGEITGGGVDIAVADEGPGIDPKVADRVFERFSRGDSDHDGLGGTGLGLSIAREIVRAHAGSIVLRNRAQGGCIAHVFLPQRNERNRG